MWIHIFHNIDMTTTTTPIPGGYKDKEYYALIWILCHFCCSCCCWRTSAHPPTLTVTLFAMFQAKFESRIQWTKTIANEVTMTFFTFDFFDKYATQLSSARLLSSAPLISTRFHSNWFDSFRLCYLLGEVWKRLRWIRYTSDEQIYFSLRILECLPSSSYPWACRLGVLGIICWHFFTFFHFRHFVKDFIN